MTVRQVHVGATRTTEITLFRVRHPRRFCLHRRYHTKDLDELYRTVYNMLWFDPKNQSGANFEYFSRGCQLPRLLVLHTVICN